MKKLSDIQNKLFDVFSKIAGKEVAEENKREISASFRELFEQIVPEEKAFCRCRREVKDRIKKILE